MPYKSKKPCGSPGCSLTVVGRKYCDKHQPMTQETKRLFDAYRGSAASRGYDRAWQRFRKSFLQDNPLCVDCQSMSPPRYTPATDVHHVKKVADHPELKLRRDNCMSLCHECHSIRTARGE